MGICGGLAGPKSGNAEKPLVFACFFNVFTDHECLQEQLQGSEPERFAWKKCYFSLKMLCGYIRNCASYAGGEHNFRNFMKTNGLKLKNGTQVVSGTSKYYQNGVGYTEMSSKECWIHHSSRPRKPPVAIIHIFATFFEVQLGRHGGDRRGKERTAER